MEQGLRHADGEAVVMSLWCFDHHNTGTVDFQIVSLVQGMQMLDLSVQAPSFATLWLLAISDQGYNSGVDWAVALLVQPGLQLEVGDLRGVIHDVSAFCLLIEMEY